MTEGNADDANGTLLVIDGHSLAFRAFFALPVESFSTSQGEATNAVWGFASMLCQVIDSERPDHLAVAFDVKGGTFRNAMLPQYKGTRDAAPQDLLDQLPLIQRMLDALGVTYIEKSGYEGDDIIATLAAMGERSRYRTLVLSGDRDAFQLIDDWVTVLYPGHHFKDLKHMTPDAVLAKYRVTPAQYPDLAARRRPSVRGTGHVRVRSDRRRPGGVGPRHTLWRCHRTLMGVQRIRRRQARSGLAGCGDVAVRRRGAGHAGSFAG